jgi:ribonucleoside-diphosphate reductase alpha chain
LKTTYYLRTLGASNIEKATVSMSQAKPMGDVAGEPSVKKEYTDAEAKACSIQAMMDGEECEACQ